MPDVQYLLYIGGALIKLIMLISALFIGLRGTKYERDYGYTIKDLIKEGIRIRPRESIY